MWKRPHDQEKPEIVDPRLEYARLIARHRTHKVRNETLPEGPPPAVDADFCFDDEESSV